MIELFLKLSILIWPFGQLLRFTFQGQNFYLLDISVAILFLALLINKDAKVRILRDKQTKYLVTFLLVATLSLIFNSSRLDYQQVIKASFYLIRLYIYPAIYFAVKFTEWKKYSSSVKASFTIFIFLGLFQYIFFPNATSLKYLGFDDHYYRLIGSTFDPNYTGLIIVILGMMFLSYKKYIAFSLALISLALTFSRASYVTAFFGLTYFSIRKNLKLLILIPVLLFIIMLSPKPFGEGVNLLRTFSIYSRFDSWNQGLNLFMAKPILGWGYNTLTDSAGGRIGIDNSFIYIMATTGIAGLISLLALIYKILQSAKNDTLVLSFTLIFFHSLFNNSLFFIWVYFMFWFLAGLSEKSKE